MKLHKYRDYQEYITAQRDGFKKKRDKVWASEENIKVLAEYLAPFKPASGICHGVRGGYEVEWFHKYLKIDKLIGSELGGSTAPWVFHWDFNKPCPGWEKSADFIYSNSFDHAYDPAATLKVWADQLKPGGLLILEWSKKHEHTGAVGKKNNAMDPVSMTFRELVESIRVWVPNAVIKDIFDMPVVRKGWQKAIVIEVR